MERAAGVEYEAVGEGDAVLLIHGAIVADSFAPLMLEPALDGYRRIRYRRRGYGNSDAPPSPPTVAAQAADALALLDHLGAGPAHVVGHSGGGPPAVQLAIDAPDMVRSLVLLEPAMQSAAMAAAFDTMISPLVEMHRAGDSGKAVHLWMRIGMGSDWRDQLEPLIPGAGEAAERDAAGTFEHDLTALRAWDFEECAGKVPHPVLHILGSRSAPHREPMTALVRAVLPQADEAVIDGADHSLPMTKAPDVAEVVAAFLP